MIIQITVLHEQGLTLFKDEWSISREEYDSIPHPEFIIKLRVEELRNNVTNELLRVMRLGEPTKPKAGDTI